MGLQCCRGIPAADNYHSEAESNLLLPTVDHGLQAYDRARAEAFYTTLTDQLRAHPGVNAVGLAEMVPLGIPVLRGRAFNERDNANAPGVIVINERFVERFWPGEDPIGRTVSVTNRDHTVIGVVPTGRYRSLGEAPLPY